MEEQTEATTYPISERKSKIKIDDFGCEAGDGHSLQGFINCLPNILAAKNFRELVKAIAKAHQDQKPVIVMMGAHVIKCGLSPVIISLMKKGIITAVAMNGAAAIHDFEIAMVGETSESVEENLPFGKFGMWEETGLMFNKAIVPDVLDRVPQGMGYCLGKYITIYHASTFPYRKMSLLGNTYWDDIPVTVHVAIGADIVHQHPSAVGAYIGQSSFRDFEIFVTEICKLENGGVVLNFGSAVIMPEIFLKALNLAVNTGHKPKDFVCANFDMIQQYRAIQNVVQRPKLLGATTYSFIGHHEIMIPLLGCAIVDAIQKR